MTVCRAEMLEEEGVVVAVESDALWVETLQTSSCDSCRARAGCGQRVLAGLLSNASRLRVVAGEQELKTYHPGQRVIIGIPGNVLVASSLVLYLLPLLVLLLAAVLAASLGARDAVVALAGIAGLLAGGGLLRYVSWRVRHHARLQPVLLGKPAAVPDEPVHLVLNHE